jgi:phosphoglycolate phosphatase
MLEAKHMTVAEFVRFLGIPAWRVPRLLTKGKRRLTQRLASIQPISGMPQALRELRARVEHLGILTSNSEENVQIFLDAHDMNHFEFLKSTPKLMGKARHLTKILRQYGFRQEEMLYVGDEIRDIEAAHEAEIPVAAVTWGFNSAAVLEAATPDYLVHHPAELVALCAPQD